MSIPHQADVLVVGAGPVGLACALSLHKHACTNIAIVDAIPKGTNSSRAIAVQISALQALDSIGCADHVTDHAYKSSVILHDQNSVIFEPDFASLKDKTKFPFACLMPEYMTEKALHDYLDDLRIQVLRPYAVAAIKPSEGHPGYSDVTMESGDVIRTRYVVGADGSKSVVRHTSGIDFKDPLLDKPATTEQRAREPQMMVADVTLTAEPTIPEGFHVIMTPHGFIFVARILPESSVDPSKPLWRFAASIDETKHQPGETFSPNAIETIMCSCGKNFFFKGEPGDPHIQEVVWSSNFRLSFAVADTLYTRSKSPDGTPGAAIMLVGDASHIHSPVGGQGMNLGICDAVALGAAIAQHAAQNVDSVGAPDDSVLIHHNDFRRPRVLEVIRATRFFTNVMTVKNPVLTTLRSWVIWMLGRFSFFRRKAAEAVSGVYEPVYS